MYLDFIKIAETYGFHNESAVGFTNILTTRLYRKSMTTHYTYDQYWS